MRLAARSLAALALGLGALAVAPAAQAQDKAEPQDDCTITWQSSYQMSDILQANNIDMAGYHAFCTRLRNANMGVDVLENSADVVGNTQGIVILRLYDLASHVSGTQSHSEMIIIPGEEEGAKTEALVTAYNLGLEVLAENVERYIDSVHSEVARLRGYYASGAPAVEDAAADADSCDISYIGSDLMMDAIDRGGFPEFDTQGSLCEQLRDAGAGLVFVGAHGEYDGLSYAWVAVGVYDRASQVDGFAWNFSVTGSQVTGAEEQESILRVSAENALASTGQAPEQLLPFLTEVTARNADWFNAGH